MSFNYTDEYEDTEDEYKTRDDEAWNAYHFNPLYYTDGLIPSGPKKIPSL